MRQQISQHFQLKWSEPGTIKENRNSISFCECWNIGVYGTMQTDIAKLYLNNHNTSIQPVYTHPTCTTSTTGINVYNQNLAIKNVQQVSTNKNKHKQNLHVPSRQQENWIILVLLISTYISCINIYGAALAATRSPVIALFWCLIKFTTTTTTTTIQPVSTYTTCTTSIHMYYLYQHKQAVQLVSTYTNHTTRIYIHNLHNQYNWHLYTTSINTYNKIQPVSTCKISMISAYMHNIYNQYPDG